MNEINNAKYAVPALDKGLDILEYLIPQEQARSQREIAQGVGRSANEIYRVLVGLEHRGYLIRDELTGRYRASLKLYNLSRSISPLDQMRQCALPLMEDLAVKIGQSCHLSMLYQSQTMIIVQALAHTPISINITEGSLFSTRTSTAGKILLANSNNEVKAMILDRDQDFAQLSELEQQAFSIYLDELSTQSYIIEANPYIESVNDYATLVGKPEGGVIAALTVSSFKTNKAEQTHNENLIENLMGCAAAITQQLAIT